MEIFIIGLATFFNLVAIKWKLENERYGDAILDISTMGIAAFLFAGTMAGMSAAMIASALMSLYLLKYPPKFDW